MRFASSIFYALTAHFGHWVAGVGHRARQWQVAAGLLYGQVKKIYRRRKLVRVTQVMRCGTRAALKTALQTLGLSGRLNTAFVERVNLTLRQSVAALVRRTWATLQDAPQLLLSWSGGGRTITSCAPMRRYGRHSPTHGNVVASVSPNG